MQSPDLFLMLFANLFLLLGKYKIKIYELLCILLCNKDHQFMMPQFLS